MESMELPDDIFATDCVTEEIVSCHDDSVAPEVAAGVSRNIIKVVQQQQQKPQSQITPIKVMGSPVKKPMVVVSAGGIRPTSTTHVHNLNNPIVISAAGAKPLQATNKSLIRPVGSTLLAHHLTTQSPRPVMLRGTQMQGGSPIIIKTAGQLQGSPMKPGTPNTVTTIRMPMSAAIKNIQAQMTTTVNQINTLILKSKEEGCDGDSIGGKIIALKTNLQRLKMQQAKMASNLSTTSGAANLVNGGHKTTLISSGPVSTVTSAPGPGKPQTQYVKILSAPATPKQGPKIIKLDSNQYAQLKTGKMPGNSLLTPNQSKQIILPQGGQSTGQRLVRLPDGSSQIVTMVTPSTSQAGNRMIMPNGPRVTAPGQRIVTLSNGQKVLTVQGSNTGQKFSNATQKIMRIKEGTQDGQKMITLLQEPQVLAKKKPKQKITVMEGGKKRVIRVTQGLSQEALMKEVQEALAAQNLKNLAQNKKRQEVIIKKKMNKLQENMDEEVDMDTDSDIEDHDNAATKLKTTELTQAQVKSNLIVAEAIAKAGGVMSGQVLMPAKRHYNKKKKTEFALKVKKTTKEYKPRKIKTKPPKSSNKKSLMNYLKGRKRSKNQDSEFSEEDSANDIREEEDDEIDPCSLVEKRRSSRQVKRRKYNDDLELNISDTSSSDSDADNKPKQKKSTKPGSAGHKVRPNNHGGGGGGDEDEDQMNSPAGAGGDGAGPGDGGPEDESNNVEKILGMRKGKRRIMKPMSANLMNDTSRDVDLDIDVEDIADDGPTTIEVEVDEYYVKYRNFSYLHCEWHTFDELLEGDKRIPQKVKRYNLKNAYNYMKQDEDEYFNSDYTEVDRVLEKSVTCDDGVTTVYYRVKWCSMTYEDSTWELVQDVDPVKIQRFEHFDKLPSEEEREYVTRPVSSEEWEKLRKCPHYKNNNILREYQLEGINWLLYSYYNRQNSILADEMGLGKTVQSITFLEEIYKYGIKGPFLIIVPLSTIGNWEREFAGWTDMNVVVYHGPTASRQMIRQYEFYYKDQYGDIVQDEYKFNAIITTFEIIISDCEILSDIHWRCAIIDEAHRLKNKNCKLMEGLRVFDLEHRVLLTGTPLQNNVEELFSLLNFLEPRRFSNVEMFLDEFGELKSQQQVEKLKALLKPIMLRRLKEDVEKSLAPKEETIVEVEMTNTQKKYYRAILEKNFSFLTKGGTSKNVPNLMNTMMELRKCCNHPFLINGAEDKITSDNAEILPPVTHYQSMIQSSGKLVLIDKLLPKLKAGNHRVLIFSQMIKLLDILEDYLMNKGYLYERIDGRNRGSVRQEAIDRFSRPDSDRFVFLLCTRAGGLGINLTAADTVIIYDSDWNPQNDLQAQARCHRIGQQKMVKIYRLITRNSYEREMFNRASLKLGLDKALLQKRNATESNAQSQISKIEIESLLKKGAYGALMDDDKAGDQFCEENIDDILSRRTQIIKIESEGKGSTFSKASFSVADTRSDIDIDDPNFWHKWAKKADIDTDMQNEADMILDMPRARKQTTRYGKNNSVNMSELDSSDSGGEPDVGSIEPHVAAAQKRRRRRRGGGRGGNGSTKDETNGDGDGDQVKPKARRRRGAGKNGDKDKNGEKKEIKEKKDKPIRYTRSDCFKVEKQLLVYGWGRWEDILAHSRFKKNLLSPDIELISRAILIYSVQHYGGDERIKGFICDLVKTRVEGEEIDYKNHTGLSAPVPRGRKGKKAKKDPLNTQALEDSLQCIMKELEHVITDEGYKRHLKRHANKVLLRVRLMYYLKMEVFSEHSEMVFNNTPVNEIDILTPSSDGGKPVWWWDDKADRSLLVGIYKHGYEKYSTMRLDPVLVFLERCGEPDNKDLKAEQDDGGDEEGEGFKEEPSLSASQSQSNLELDVVDEIDEEDEIDDEIDDDDDENDDVDCQSRPQSPGTAPSAATAASSPSTTAVSSQDVKVKCEDEDDEDEEDEGDDETTKTSLQGDATTPSVTSGDKKPIKDLKKPFIKPEMGKYEFPSTADLNTRLRRLITCYQRLNKRKQLKIEQKAKKVARKEKFQALLQDREQKKKDNQQSHWSRREEADFYRIVSTYGVELKRVKKEPKVSVKEEESDVDVTNEEVVYDWHKFRNLAHLERKYDETLTEYFKAFYYMIKRICRMVDQVSVSPNEIVVEPISEERAARCLARIDLLSKVREQTLRYADLNTRLQTCRMSMDLPEWWQPGTHDRDLLIGVARHGFAHTECHILYDQTLAFHDIVTERIANDRAAAEQLAKEVASNDDTNGDTNNDSKSKNLTIPAINDMVDSKANSSDEDVDKSAVNSSQTEAQNSSKQWQNPFLHWPKDRVVFHRTEHVVYAVESGVWPRPRASTGAGGSGNTSSGASGGGSAGASTTGGANSSTAAGQSQSASGHDYSLTPSSTSKRKKKKLTEEEENDPTLMDEITTRKYQEKQKRLENWMKAEEKAALKRRHDELMKQMNPDLPVSVHNMATGHYLTGSDAPLRKNLHYWLEDNPGYMETNPITNVTLPETRKKQNKKRFDPTKMEIKEVTGEVPIVVVNRHTGKAIKRQRAPILNDLPKFLAMNPAFDIEEKWSALIRKVGCLPKSLESRLLDKTPLRPGVQGGLLSPGSTPAIPTLSPVVTPAPSAPIPHLHPTAAATTPATAISSSPAPARAPIVLAAGKSLLKSNNPSSATTASTVITAKHASAANIIRTAASVGGAGGGGVTIRHQVGRPLATGITPGPATVQRPVGTMGSAKVIHQATVVTQPPTGKIIANQANQAKILTRLPVSPKVIPSTGQKSGLKVIPSQGIQQYRAHDNKAEQIYKSIPANGSVLNSSQKSPMQPIKLIRTVNGTVATSGNVPAGTSLLRPQSHASLQTKPKVYSPSLLRQPVSQKATMAQTVRPVTLQQRGQLPTTNKVTMAVDPLAVRYQQQQQQQQKLQLQKQQQQLQLQQQQKALQQQQQPQAQTHQPQVIHQQIKPVSLIKPIGQQIIPLQTIAVNRTKSASKAPETIPEHQLQVFDEQQVSYQDDCIQEQEIEVEEEEEEEDDEEEEIGVEESDDGEYDDGAIYGGTRVQYSRADEDEDDEDEDDEEDDDEEEEEEDDDYDGGENVDVNDPMYTAIQQMQTSAMERKINQRNIQRQEQQRSTLQYQEENTAMLEENSEITESDDDDEGEIQSEEDIEFDDYLSED